MCAAAKQLGSGVYFDWLADSDKPREYLKFSNVGFGGCQRLEGPEKE
jgi:hypothetical protein